MGVRVQAAAFAPGVELDRFTAGVDGAGAVVSFTGVVRDEGGRLVALDIEHYPAMTDRTLAELHRAAMDRWSLQAALILHRHGRLAVGEPIMMVATAATHRAAAFAAADFLMDHLKSQAPFWKQEHRRDGSTAWVAPRDADAAALARWNR